MGGHHYTPMTGGLDFSAVVPVALDRCPAARPDGQTDRILVFRACLSGCWVRSHNMTFCGSQSWRSSAHSSFVARRDTAGVELRSRHLGTDE